jgi:hypothetical protein
MTAIAPLNDVVGRASLYIAITLLISFSLFQACQIQITLTVNYLQQQWWL